MMLNPVKHIVKPLIPITHSPNLHKVCTLPTHAVQVRFRKPRHLGRATSKDQSYFKKYPPTKKDLQANQFLYHNYNTMLKSLVAAFQEELVMKDKGQVATDEWVWDEKAHHQKCMMYNDAENKRMREIRLRRINDQKVALESKAAERRRQTELVRLAEEQQRRDIVTQTLKESEEWLTLENMDRKITEAVDNPVNYNFAVNRKGFITRRTALVLPPDDDRIYNEAASG